MEASNQPTVRAFVIAINAKRRERNASSSVMLRECAWCDIVLGVKECSGSEGGTTHGICEACKKELTKGMRV